MTKKTEYIPRGSSKKLLEVLLNPEHRLKNVTEICNLVGCSRKTYYALFKKPEFVSFYTEQSKNLICQSVGPVINACIKAAVGGDHNHAKIILGMAGLYTEKRQMRITPDPGPQGAGQCAAKTKELKDSTNVIDIGRGQTTEHQKEKE